MPIQLSQQLEGSFRNKDLTMSFFIYFFLLIFGKKSLGLHTYKTLHDLVLPFSL